MLLCDSTVEFESLGLSETGHITTKLTSQRYLNTVVLNTNSKAQCGRSHRVLACVPVPVSEASAGVMACWCLVRSRCSM